MALFGNNKKTKKILSEYYRSIKQNSEIEKDNYLSAYPGGEDEFVYVGMMINHFALKDDGDEKKLKTLMDNYTSTRNLYDSNEGNIIKCILHLQDSDYDYYKLPVLATVLYVKNNSPKGIPATAKHKIQAYIEQIEAEIDKENERLNEEARKHLLHKYTHAMAEGGIEFSKDDPLPYARMFQRLRGLIRDKLSIREIVQMYNGLKPVVLDESISDVDIIIEQEKRMESICDNARFILLQERKSLACAMTVILHGGIEHPEEMKTPDEMRKLQEKDEKAYPEKYDIEDRSVEFTGEDRAELERQGYELEDVMTMHVSVSLKDGSPASIHTYTVHAKLPDSDGLDDRDYSYTIKPHGL